MTNGIEFCMKNAIVFTTFQIMDEFSVAQYNQKTFVTWFQGRYVKCPSNNQEENTYIIQSLKHFFPNGCMDANTLSLE